MAKNNLKSNKEYRIIISDRAKKSLRKIDSRYHSKIKNNIIMLASDPYVGKKLDGKYSGLYSLRVWPYRIIYSVIKNELMVSVIGIEHRQGVYKR